MQILKIGSEAAAREFGRELADRLKAGDIVALSGDLGTGKTTLTQAIAQGLGVKEPVTSPTFAIIKEYHSGRLPLYHLDVYRISGPEDMYELGYEEYFFGGGVCVVEWAELIEELLPESALRIHISYGSGETDRLYRIETP
ncbi:MAG: tRNA (adenosine(37)-N6)-threonylcarbamoyltransferase complex ATPase subunit type 1 TsaE [Bacillota bacterium]|nr:tRNA (adenosine(37)-N6)-threonylcarbamoyltransferase complex ATPase subunit type 1 TsaE [Bacillota bacterium]